MKVTINESRHPGDACTELDSTALAELEDALKTIEAVVGSVGKQLNWVSIAYDAGALKQSSIMLTPDR